MAIRGTTLPKTKQELANWVVRRLGAPVINVEVADIQLEECIDEAVQFYQEYHYDGSQRSYRTFKISNEVLLGNNRRPQGLSAPVYDSNNQYRIGDRVMTSDEKNTDNAIWVKRDSENPAIDSENAYQFSDLWIREEEALADKTSPYDYTNEGQVGIPLPDNIIGVSKVFRIDQFSGMGMWNYEYQYFLNNFDFFYGSGGASSGMITNYYTTKSYMELINQVMNIQPSIRFNKHKNRLYIDTSWERLKNTAENDDFYLLIECYEASNPEVDGDVYSDSWLKRYATALTKMQWGANLKKYQNTELPGGIVLSGQELYDEGKQEAEKLEEELMNATLEMDSILLG